MLKTQPTFKSISLSSDQIKKIEKIARLFLKENSRDKFKVVAIDEDLDDHEILYAHSILKSHYVIKHSRVSGAHNQFVKPTLQIYNWLDFWNQIAAQELNDFFLGQYSYNLFQYIRYRDVAGYKTVHPVDYLYPIIIS